MVNKLRYNLDIEIRTSVEEINCNNPLILMTIFRIVKECLNSALKHSSGNKVILTLKNEDNIHCSIVIEDNGQNFDFNKIISIEGSRHFGLCILKERVEL